MATLANSHVVSVDTSLSDTILTGFDLSVSTTTSNEVEISVRHSTISSGSLPANAKVVANGLIDGATALEPVAIETEKINFGEGFRPEPYNFISSATQLTTWAGDMPNLKSGYNMFAERSNIESFCGDLSAMTNGSGMFSSCNNLKSFTSDLSSLMDGNGMFGGCNLDAESVECIADTINEHEGEISITWATEGLPAEDKRQKLVDELSRIVDKGWTLETNQELLPLFDSEKYETGSTSVQPLDLESEPRTIYYVVKK